MRGRDFRATAAQLSFVEGVPCQPTSIRSPLRHSAPAELDRCGNGRGHAPHIVLADPQLQPRLLSRDLRYERPSDCAGRAHAHPRRRDSVGTSRSCSEFSAMIRPGDVYPAERSVSRQQPPAGPHRVRAGLRTAIGPTVLVDQRWAHRATSVARLMALTIRARPRSGRRACAYRRSGCTRPGVCATTSLISRPECPQRAGLPRRSGGDGGGSSSR